MHPSRMLLPTLSLLILPLTQANESPGQPDPSLAEPAAEVQPIAQDVGRPSFPRPPQQSVPSKGHIEAMIDRLARTQALDPVLVHALIRAESGYDPQAVSPVGAVGLMQVMPETAADYGVQSVDQLFDPEVNLRTGMRHLKRLLGKYGAIGPAVMAYNAGEGALERSGGFVIYSETQRYTHRVLTDYLLKKGLRPYSEQARDHIGLDLRPEMAIAGDTGSVDPAAKPRQPLDQDRWSSRFDTGALQQPKLLRPLPQSGPRLSSQLDTASNSSLKSRLMTPSRERLIDTNRRSLSPRLAMRQP